MHAAIYSESNAAVRGYPQPPRSTPSPPAREKKLKQHLPDANFHLLRLWLSTIRQIDIWLLDIGFTVSTCWILTSVATFRQFDTGYFHLYVSVRRPWLLVHRPWLLLFTRQGIPAHRALPYLQDLSSAGKVGFFQEKYFVSSQDIRSYPPTDENRCNEGGEGGRLSASNAHPILTEERHRAASAFSLCAQDTHSVRPGE